MDSVLVSSILFVLLDKELTLQCSFFFFGGLSIPLSQAILAHMFSYNITWSATKKEVERSNFFKEVPKICKRCVSFFLFFLHFFFQFDLRFLLASGLDWSAVASASNLIDARFIGHVLISALRWRPLFV